MDTGGDGLISAEELARATSIVGFVSGRANVKMDALRWLPCFHKGATRVLLRLNTRASGANSNPNQNPNPGAFSPTLYPTWDVIAGLALLCTAATTPFEVGFLDPPKSAMEPMFILNRIIDGIFVIDIIFQFFIMYRRLLSPHTADHLPSKSAAFHDFPQRAFHALEQVPQGVKWADA